MAFRIALIATLLVFSPLLVCASGDIAASQPPPSFLQLVGPSDWQVSLKDFTVRTVRDGKVFSLRTGEGRYLSFSAHSKNGENTNHFGPLQPGYAPTLTGLLEYAMRFGEMDKKGELSLNVDWELYPDSIRKWAIVWKDSELREKWKDMGPQEGYPQLVGMISKQLKEDMQPLARALGFKTTGASMEKMVFQEIRKLPYFEETLKPAGIPADLALPMPLILSIQLKPQKNVAVSPPENANPVTVDSLFAIAQSSSASLYCSFQRALDEYEISGDTLNSDGTFAQLLPLSQKEYHPMAAQLLNACLQATGGNERSSFALRMNLDLYPEVYREVVKQFTFNPDKARKLMVPRTQLPKLRFYAFEPSQASGFAATVNSFLKPNGFEFRHFQVSVDSRRKAASYTKNEKAFRSLGIKPEDRPTVPDIVYMIVEKKQG
jgi:hypothetical protein